MTRLLVALAWGKGSSCTMPVLLKACVISSAAVLMELLHSCFVQVSELEVFRSEIGECLHRYMSRDRS